MVTTGEERRRDFGGGSEGSDSEGALRLRGEEEARW